MKNLFIWLGLGLVIVAAVMGALTGLEGAVWIELAAAAGALASCITGIVKKADKKDWKLYVAICGTVIGVILVTFAGVAGTTIKAVITAVIGLVVLVLSIIPTIAAGLKKKD